MKYRKPKPCKGADKDLRRARDRFSSPKTQQALSEAIAEVPSATVFDTERIKDQLFRRLGEFKHIERFQDFRAAVVAWATGQARLTVKLREILRELFIHGHVVTMLFLRLPEFAGLDEEFRGWVEATAKREQEGIEALASWITQHRRAVRGGIWNVLGECMDLDLGEFIAEIDDTKHLVLDELESQVWREVVYSTDQILSSSEPISRQLWWKGYWAAMAWKKRRLDEKEKHAGEKYIIGLHGLERIIRSDDGDDEIGITGDDIIDPNGNLNPIVICECPWKQADLERELRRAGPFRADDVYETAGQTVAAA